jgi:hypothetical protein
VEHHLGKGRVGAGVNFIERTGAAFQNYEVVIFEGGSSDKTKDLLMKYI